MTRAPLFCLSLCAASLGGFLALPSVAYSQTEFDFRGTVESDMRVALPDFPRDDAQSDVFFDRLDNAIRLTAGMYYEDIEAVANLGVIYSAFTDIGPFNDLTHRTKVDPFYFESDALYIRIYDFIVEGVDLRIGRQIIDWGAADRFNPTSVINPYDLEDPMDFGRRVANEMVTLSITPDWIIEGEETPILDEISLTAVFVPLFRSGLVPSSAELAFTSPTQFARFVKSDLLTSLVGVQNFFLEERDGSVVYNLQIEEPDADIENVQIGLRGAMSLFGIDISGIYYYGYDQNVQPSSVAIGNVTTATGLEFPYPDNTPSQTSAELIQALTDFEDLFGASFVGASVVTDVELVYPKVHVLGANINTSLDFLGGLGIWAEFAATIHDGVPLAISLGPIPTCNSLGPDGEPIDPMATCVPEEHQVDPGWFWKLTAGMDYSITSWWYVNVQYLHGFLDEFGSEWVGDYIVAGMDFKVWDEQILIRLFSITELPTKHDDSKTLDVSFDGEASAVLYPEINFGFWQNLDFLVGALLHVGSGVSKFGSPTAGPNVAFLKGKYSF